MALAIAVAPAPATRRTANSKPKSATTISGVEMASLPIHAWLAFKIVQNYVRQVE